MVAPYVPEKGDLVILNFNPQTGREQQGKRPALIISNGAFNKKVGLAFACPITNTDRKIPFHLAVQGKRLTGFVMTEQIKSIDYKARGAKFIEKAKPTLLAKTLAIVESIVS